MRVGELHERRGVSEERTLRGARKVRDKRDEARNYKERKAKFEKRGEIREAKGRRG